MKKFKNLPAEPLVDSTTGFHGLGLVGSYVHGDLLECLIQAGVDINKLASNGSSLLDGIAECSGGISDESFHRIMICLRNNSYQHFNKLDECGKTSLQVMLLTSEIDLLDETLDLFRSVKTDFNSQDHSGLSVLFHAIQDQKSLRVIKSLVKHGANINHHDDVGRNVLHCCALYAKLDVLKYFVDEQGMDLRSRDSVGNTPLHSVFERSYISDNIIQFLIENSTVNSRNINDYVPFSYAYKNFKRSNGIRLKDMHLMEVHGLTITNELASQAIHDAISSLISHGTLWTMCHHMQLEYLIKKAKSRFRTTIQPQAYPYRLTIELTSSIISIILHIDRERAAKRYFNKLGFFFIDDVAKLVFNLFRNGNHNIRWWKNREASR